MADDIALLAAEKTNTTGLGNYVPAGKLWNSLTFAETLTPGVRYPFSCYHDNGTTVGVEHFWGIWNPDIGVSGVIIRDQVIKSSNDDELVPWGSGTKELHCTLTKAWLEALATSLTAVVDDSGGPVTAFTYDTDSTLNDADSKTVSWSVNGVEVANFGHNGLLQCEGISWGTIFGNYWIVFQLEVRYEGLARFGGGNIEIEGDTGGTQPVIAPATGKYVDMRIGQAFHTFGFSVHDISSLTVGGNHGPPFGNQGKKGGDTALRGGDGQQGSTTGGAGGAVTVKGGAGHLATDGGDVTIEGGDPGATGERGNIRLANLPTSSAGLPTDAIWNDSGTLKVT